MWSGIFSGLMACVLWAVTYQLPLLLPDYSPGQSGLVRCVILGLFSIGMLYFVRREVRQLSLSDWICAAKLSIVGMIINFLAMLYCADMAGVSIAGLTTGAIPVVIAIVANERDRRRGKTFVALGKLIVPLLLMCVGFALCNLSELLQLEPGSSYLRFFIGVALGISHTLLWTWYPIVNADWLNEHPHISSVTWSTVQCAILFPSGLAIYLAYWHFLLPGVPILGPRPGFFTTLLAFNGLLCCWGALCLWNYLCKKVPTSLAGQIQVFETIFAIVFAHIILTRWPNWDLIAGSALLVIGICWSLKLFSDAMEKEVGR